MHFTAKYFGMHGMSYMGKLIAIRVYVQYLMITLLSRIIVRQKSNLKHVFPPRFAAADGALATTRNLSHEQAQTLANPY